MVDTGTITFNEHHHLQHLAISCSIRHEDKPGGSAYQIEKRRERKGEKGKEGNCQCRAAARKEDPRMVSQAMKDPSARIAAMETVRRWPECPDIAKKKKGTLRSASSQINDKHGPG